MSLYEELHAEELQGHAAYLEKIFELRKKNITRQNSADIEKRFEAENMLKVLGDLQTLLEKCGDDFPYDATIIKIYDFFRENDLEYEDKISALNDVLSGELERADYVGSNIRLKNEFVLYNDFADLVNWLGGSLEKIDLSLSEEEIVFEERVNMMGNMSVITMTSGDEPEDGLNGIEDYLVEANREAEGKPLYEKYKRIRSEAMADLMNGVMNEISFSRFKNDGIVIGMEPVGEEENGIVKFPLTMHVREFGPERVRVDYTQPIPGIMEVKKWTPEATRYVINEIIS